MNVLLWILGWLLVGYLSIIYANKVVCPRNKEKLGACIGATFLGPVLLIPVISLSFTEDYPLKRLARGFTLKILRKIYFLEDKNSEKTDTQPEKGLECDKICRTK